MVEQPEHYRVVAADPIQLHLLAVNDVVLRHAEAAQTAVRFSGRGVAHPGPNRTQR